MREGADRKPRGRACGPLKATVRKTNVGSRLVYTVVERSLSTVLGRPFPPAQNQERGRLLQEPCLPRRASRWLSAKRAGHSFPPPQLTPFLF